MTEFLITGGLQPGWLIHTQPRQLFYPLFLASDRLREAVKRLVPTRE
jgi:hypothetical protein